MRRAHGGFSMLELMVVLLALSLLVGAGVVAVKRYQAQTQAAENEGALLAADEALIAFARFNRRLPCPDSDNDGLENCSSLLGQLPYRTLGLDAVPVDGRRRPLQYLVNQTVIAAAANGYAFCQSLRNQSRAFDPTRLSSDRGVNLAYAIVSPGDLDVNRDGSVMDLISFDTANASYRIASGNNVGARDDVLRSRGFYSLQGMFNCPGTIVALNSMEHELAVSKLTKRTLELTQSQLDTLIGSAETEKLLAAMSIASAAGSTASAIANAIDATGETIFGNAAATVAAIAAGVAVAAAVVAVVEAALIIDEANQDIATHTAQKALIDHHLSIISSLCSNIRGVLVNQKGNGGLTCG